MQGRIIRSPDVNVFNEEDETLTRLEAKTPVGCSHFIPTAYKGNLDMLHDK